MNVYDICTDIDAIEREAETIPLDVLSGGFITNYRQGPIIRRGGLSKNDPGYIVFDTLALYPTIRNELDALLHVTDSSVDEEIFQCWLGVLDAKTGDLAPHKDGKMPGDPRRYHLPIRTNYQAMYWDEIHGDIQMKRGIWYGPIPYMVYHQTINRGDTDRWHLVVDIL